MDTRTRRFTCCPCARALMLLALTLAASGCTGLFGEREVAPAAVFVLGPGPAAAPRPDPGGPVILVSRPGAGPGFTGTQMVYSDTPYQLEAFARHRWADTPANMLEPLVVNALESSGSFRRVAARSSSS